MSASTTKLEMYHRIVEKLEERRKKDLMARIILACLLFFILIILTALLTGCSCEEQEDKARQALTSGGYINISVRGTGPPWIPSTSFEYKAEKPGEPGKLYEGILDCERNKDRCTISSEEVKALLRPGVPSP